MEERTRAWYGEQRRISYVQPSAALTQWKKSEELAFLYEVSSVRCSGRCVICRLRSPAFCAKRAKYPRYKSRSVPRANSNADA
nr:hypothetical protein [Streptomyces canus]